VRNESGVMEKNGVDLWMTGTDTAKSALFARLDGDLLHERYEDRMVRYSAELPATFFEGIASEFFDADTGKWEKRPGKRNEPLDTWNYAYAAAHHPRIAIHTARAADWEELERLLEPRVNDMFARATSDVHTSAQVDEVATADVAPQVVHAPEGGPRATVSDRENDWVPDMRDNW
jgi:phage terminase large subunit GpA-like protein